MSTFLTNIESRASLLLQGQDSRKFLQGQATCDVEALHDGDSLPGALCNPQGRMITDFRVWQLTEDELVLGLHHSLVETVTATLAKYLMFSRATLEPAPGRFCQLAVWGDTAASLLGAGEDCRGWQFHGAAVTPSSVPGAYELLVPADALAAVTDALSDAETVPEQRWLREEIDHGVAHVCEETTGMFLPQMLNYQATGHVSFTKGCYTGQEVVARMHYRGKVKRPLHRFRTQLQDRDIQLPPGTPLFRTGSEQPVGQMASAVIEGDTLWLLASVASDAVADGVFLGEQRLPLESRPLPENVAAARA
ncbi:MAG: hypothetical protein V2J89_06170 [Halieaceae bacterium]|jgi:folate-binding protein YgfZ|nr:hypothetical protein [Halieaceae bacterium]